GREIKENNENRRLETVSQSDGRNIYRISNAQTDKLKNINLEIKKGEIVGLAGLLGSGRTEIGRLIFGADTTEKGQIEINGDVVKIKSLRQTISQGFALIPEDRRVEGIIPNMSVKENITLANLPNISKFGAISRRNQIEIANKYIAQLQIRTPSANQPVKLLSGGNQQKVKIGRASCRE